MTTKSKKYMLSAVCGVFAAATAGGAGYAKLTSANAENSAITGATLALGNSISMRYYAESAGSGALTMRFTLNGMYSGAVKATANGENGVYFDYDVAPQCMGDEVTAELYDGETKIAEKKYSVAEYCKAKIADENSDEDLKTLCADILAYGAAAQTYTGHNATELVNAENAGEPTEFEEIEESDFSLTGTIDENTKFTGGNCYFNGTNRVYFLFETNAYSELTFDVKKDGEAISYEVVPQGEEGKYAIIADVYAGDFGAVYTASLTKGENTQKVNYSLKSYVYYWQNRTEEDGETLTPMANLARALWNYGTSSNGWYYTPVISETETSITVKAGETYKFPQLTATNRAGETCDVTVSVNGEAYDDSATAFYRNGKITYLAGSHDCYAAKDVDVNVDFDGVNLADSHYLDTAANRFYGIYGATFYGNVGGTQKIGRFEGKQIYDERVDIGMSVTKFVGSMSFNLRGGSETVMGLSLKIENSGGGRVQIYNGSEKLMDTDETMPDTAHNSGYWDGILQKSFNLSVQVTDKKDEEGNITAIIVKAALGDLSVTGENGFEIAVNESNKTTLTSKGWLFIEGGANTDWMKENLYIHSMYLNTPDYPSNLILSSWNYKNSNGILTGASNENGIQYAAVTTGDNKNTYTDNSRNYTDYGMYDGEKVKDQKVKITAKAAFKSGDDFCVYFRGNNYPNNNWRWIRRGLFVSFSADEGVRICLGEAAFSYNNETKVYTTYTNADIKAACGKTLSELFAAGITLEMQASDVTDDSGKVTAVNIRIWINGIAINGAGYEAEKLDFNMDGATGDCIFNEGYLMLGGKISDSEGYISGVYLED